MGTGGRGSPHRKPHRHAEADSIVFPGQKVRTSNKCSTPNDKELAGKPSYTGNAREFESFAPLKGRIGGEITRNTSNPNVDGFNSGMNGTPPSGTHVVASGAAEHVRLSNARHNPVQTYGNRTRFSPTKVNESWTGGESANDMWKTSSSSIGQHL